MSATMHVATTQHGDVTARWYRVDMADYYGEAMEGHEYLRMMEVGELETMQEGTLLVGTDWSSLALHDKAEAYVREEIRRARSAITDDYPMERHPVWAIRAGEHRPTIMLEAVDPQHARDQAAFRLGFQDHENYSFLREPGMIIRALR